MLHSWSARVAFSEETAQTHTCMHTSVCAYTHMFLLGLATLKVPFAALSMVYKPAEQGKCEAEIREELDPYARLVLPSVTWASCLVL